jgi:outer membrane biosynthesis protein TonB
MANQFDNERHRKAFIYTGIICSVLLAAFFLISWKTKPPSPPIVQEQMEINLGNNEEGFGEVQPLVKGEPSPPEESTPPPPTASAEPAAATEPEVDDNITPDNNAPAEAAPVSKPVVKPSPVVINRPKEPVTKPVIKPTIPTVAKPTTMPTPKPAKPKIIMPGATGKTGGNNANQDNGYNQQGTNKNGNGDKGVPTGKKDTYGNKEGGSVNGPKVISGNRTVSYRSFNFTDELEKATINAVVKVSAAGVGTFVKFAAGSTTTDARYANAIRRYLTNMPFDKQDHEDIVTVQFRFNVKQN